MKTIIAGSRGYPDSWVIEILDSQYCTPNIIDITEVFCGGARGPDTSGKNWAYSLGVPVRMFPADWENYGRRAGFLRNEQMATHADALIAFWDGESKGTKHMIDLALRHGLETHVYISKSRPKDG